MPTQITPSQMVMKLHAEQRDLFTGASQAFIHGGAVFTDHAGNQWTTGAVGADGSALPKAPEPLPGETQTAYAERVAAMLPPIRDLGDKVADILDARGGIGRA